MASVDMEEVDRSVGEEVDGFVEPCLEQAREGAIEPIVVVAQVGQDLGPVEAGLLITAPMVDRVAACIASEDVDRLAERAVRVAAVRSELDDQARARELYGEHPEGDMFPPRRLRGYAARAYKEDRVVEHIEQRSHCRLSRCVRVNTLSVRPSGMMPDDVVAGQ